MPKGERVGGTLWLVEGRWEGGSRCTSNSELFVIGIPLAQRLIHVTCTRDLLQRNIHFARLAVHPPQHHHPHVWVDGAVVVDRSTSQASLQRQVTVLLSSRPRRSSVTVVAVHQRG